MKIVYVVIAVILVVMIIMTIVGPENMPTFKLYSTGKSECTCPTEFIKKQWVRVLDVLVLGPFALWLGYRLQTDGYGIVPYILYAYAFGTIVYNYSNMLAYANSGLM